MSPEPDSAPPRDRRGRPLSDLRVSVTDRCNFRCRYCMPREHFGPGFRFLPRSDLLSFEEVARVVRILAGEGLRKVRLTGGEPLLRAQLPKLVRMIAETGVDTALTTNGSLLAKHAQALADAGLARVSVSLDSLDDAVFHALTDADYGPADVLAGIDAAARAGLSPIKINAVVRRGQNDHTLVDLARRFKGSGHIVRFIEYMDVGLTNGWRLDEVVPGREIVERIDAALPLEPVDPNYAGEVARRYRYRDGGGEIGVITSVTEPFCRGCTRARLSAEGTIYGCLFAASGTDIRGPLRSGANDSAIAELICGIWARRDDRYSELRSSRTAGLRRIEMSYIGG